MWAGRAFQWIFNQGKNKTPVKGGHDNLAMLLFCVYFDLVTDLVYRTVQLIQHKSIKEMYLINFVNFALLLPIFLN